MSIFKRTLKFFSVFNKNCLNFRFLRKVFLVKFDFYQQVNSNYKDKHKSQNTNKNLITLFSNFKEDYQLFHGHLTNNQQSL